MAEGSQPTRRGKTNPRRSSSRTRRRRQWSLKVPLLPALQFVVEWLSLTVVASTAALWVFSQAYPSSWFVRPPWLRWVGSMAAALVSAIGLMAGWSLLRARLAKAHRFFPSVLACLLAVAAGFLLVQGNNSLQGYAELRRQLATREESERDRIAHQVYAAYRRAKLEELTALLRRATPYLPAIDEAAARFHLPLELLVGIAATESSFLPRTSRDGGRGLFQITAPPEAARRVVERLLKVRQLDLDNPRDNSFLAAATLRYYWQQQNGDLFLALLAYNIGPTNGGLLEIMQRYGAKDFLTIQPYLQALPADYPIRVLTAALAYRLWLHYGQLLRYELGDNARKIQSLGIPGLDSEGTEERIGVAPPHRSVALTPEGSGKRTLLNGWDAPRSGSALSAALASSRAVAVRAILRLGFTLS